MIPSAKLSDSLVESKPRASGDDPAFQAWLTDGNS